MDRNNAYLGSYGSMDPSMQVGVNSGSNSMVSPYLNFDPSLLSGGSNEPQFILPEGQSHRRGRFELAFAQIGGSVMTGGVGGGCYGLVNGFKETGVAQITGAVKRTQMINYIAKQGAASAQTLGIVALMYSGIGAVLGWARGAEDEINTVAAGTATGLLYKSSAGLRAVGKGGAVGLGLSVAFVLVTSGDRIKQILKMD